MTTLLTPAQAAQQAGVTAKTITRWVDQGRLPATRTLGGHRRIHPDTLTTLIAEASTKEQKP
jgi:MerR family transcriptional regulator, light-induced transcriptional regulator